MGKKPVVCIDAGHGGKDPGAVGNGAKEKDFNLAIALEVGKELEKNDVTVVYTRTTDVFIELKERSNIANRQMADAFVSIHINSADRESARGVETFCYPGSFYGGKLANSVQDYLVASGIFSANRGVKTNQFSVLRYTDMAAILVELGFISNRDDVALLHSKWKLIAKTIAEGIMTFLDVPIKVDPVLQEGKVLHNQLQTYLRSLPASDYAKKASKKAVDKGIFVDIDKDGLVDDPKAFLTREQLAVVLDRLGLL